MVKKVGSDINSIKNTNDGGYIIGGNFHDSVELGNGITIQVRGYNSCACLLYTSPSPRDA